MMKRKALRITAFASTALTSMMLIQGLFHFLQNEQASSTEKLIQALLRQEVTINNLFLLSRTLNDIQDAGLVECVVLQEKTSPQPYLDLRYRGSCDSSPWNLKGKAAATPFHSLNGSTWDVRYRTINGRFFGLSLWLARTLSLILLAAGARWHFSKMERAEKETARQEKMNTELERRVQEQVSEITRITLEKEKASIQAQIAAQVSHDIRSPLATLLSIMHVAKGLDDANRSQLKVSVSRIREIADGLLARNREAQPQAPGSLPRVGIPHDRQGKSVESIFSLLAIAVSQKILQFQDRPEVPIQLESTPDASLSFSEVQALELHRLISNLINNAMDAINGSGAIRVSLYRRAHTLLIQISDTGKGIPGHLLKKVILRGGTFGKANGNGLGLSHAKSTIESWGGALDLQSEEGKGTNVTLEIPTVPPPEWFPGKIQISPDSTVVIASGNPEMQSLWKRRFRELNPGHSLIELTSSRALLDWFRRNTGTVESPCYIMDFDLPGSDQNGLELIDTLGIAPDSILVTSPPDDLEIRQKCGKRGIRLLPKALAFALPMELT